MEVDGTRLMGEVQEHGHDTGSKGWGFFDKEESQRALLRTHTTVAAIRHIADNPHTPSESSESGGCSGRRP